MLSKIIKIQGLTGTVVFLLALISLPHFFVRTPSPAEAEAVVHNFLEGEASRQYMQEHRDRGDMVNKEIALRWAEQFEKVKNLRFRAIDIRRTLIVTSLTKPTTFIVRVEIDDYPQQVRYFRIKGSSVYETSRTWWYIPLL